MSIGKIERVDVEGEKRLSILWDDGVRLPVNLARLVAERSALAPLRADGEFARVRVSADGWSLEWPSGVDFGAPQLRRWAEEQAAASVAPIDA